MTRRLRGEDGATAVEFALVFPVALFLLGWVIYGGFYFVYRAVAEHDVRSATHKLTFTSGYTYADGTALQFPVTQQEALTALSRANPGFVPDPTTVQVSYICSEGTGSTETGTCSDPVSGDIVQVTAQFATPVLDALRWSTLGVAPSGVTVSVSVSGRLE